MPIDTRLLAVSYETAGSNMSESIAVGFSDPLGWNGVMGPSNTAAFVTLLSGGGTSCRLPTAAGSHFLNQHGVDIFLLIETFLNPGQAFRLANYVYHRTNWHQGAVQPFWSAVL